MSHGFSSAWIHWSCLLPCVGPNIQLAPFQSDRNAILVPDITIVKEKKSSFPILSLESEDAILSISYWIFPHHIGQNCVTFLPLHHDWLKPFRSHPVGLGPACLQRMVRQRRSHVAPWTKQQWIQWDSLVGVGNTKQLWRTVSQNHHHLLHSVGLVLYVAIQSFMELDVWIGSNFGIHSAFL